MLDGGCKPNAPKEVVIKLYKSDDKIFARQASGYFTNWRWAFVWLTQLFFYGVPWLNWNGRQAMLFDLDSKVFYIFGLIFSPQDLIYLTFLLIVSALSLFLFTAVAGRLWCGFACPQTVYTEIFMWIENKIEGNFVSRMKMDKQKYNLNKISRKGLKHFVWIVFGLWTGITFVGYFTPIRELVPNIYNFSLSGWEWFWVLFYGFATYGNAGFMREQVCKYMCPYARFQSAMFDDDTLIVTYDKERGEPRGARSKKDDEHVNGLGSCIDCNICVQVCPVGIDIRNGLQYECIGCGACIDACDSVMDQMGYAKGLIKMSTQNAVEKKWSKSLIVRRIFRPRVLIYSAVLWTLIIGMTVGLYLKDEFSVNVNRDRSVLARFNSEGLIENVYNLKIQNESETKKSFQINVEGIEGLVAHTSEGRENSLLDVNPFESRYVIVEVNLKENASKSGSHPIVFEIKDDKGDVVKEKSVFIVPSE